MAEEPVEVAESPHEDETEAPRLDPEVEARRSAAMSFIKRLGDPVLKSSATKVDHFDEALQGQVARMAGLMNDALGIGLAAPQLGVSQRLLIYRVGPDAPADRAGKPPRSSGRATSRTCSRRAACRCRACRWTSNAPYTSASAPATSTATSARWRPPGLEARVIQHEMDHLDGVLILDRGSREQRKEAMRAIRDAEERRERAA